MTMNEAAQSKRYLAWFTSICLHAALVGLALMPWAVLQEKAPSTTLTQVMLYNPSRLPLPTLQTHTSEGGGGGGRRAPRPASLGHLPRAADRQFVPPDPEPPKNTSPELVMEPTIVAQFVMPQNLFSVIGDPKGVVGPPSPGPGNNNGIGTGNHGGVGDKDGPGTGDKTGIGSEGSPRTITGGVSAPTIVYRVEPEYSEEARKARYQGTVVLQTVIRRDGTVDVVNVVRSLGFGLDQNAIQALKQWRFRPAMYNGSAVDVTINIEVNFNLR